MAEPKTTVELLRHVASTYPDRVALVDGDRRITYADWDRRSDMVAGAFAKRGVSKGDVICLLLPSSIEYAVCYQAAMRLGAITSGVNPRLGPAEKASIIERTRPVLTIADAAEVPTDGPAPPTIELSPDDEVAVVWTSGTTGRPKGAVFDHNRLRAMSAGAGDLSHDGDVRLSPVPFAHVAWMTRQWDEIVHAMTVVITTTPWTAADALRLIEEERVTLVQGVPAQWALMLRHERTATTDFASVRLAASGSAPIEAHLVHEIRDRLGCPFVSRYASTEASIISSTSIDDPPEVAATTVGRASPTVELRVDAPYGEVGAIRCRSAAMLKRYWDDPCPIDDQGWLDTGDLGRVDGGGNLVVVGRAAEMYIRGGYNVYPAEVEDVIALHPDVDAAAVVGVPDEVLGDIGVAFVVPRGEQNVELDELRAHVKRHLADYKAPDRLVVVDDLPRTAMAKVDKQALRKAVPA